MTRTYRYITILGIAVATMCCYACADDQDQQPAPAYIRVLDIQHGAAYTSLNTSLSVFRWDGLLYNNAALDTVETPKYTVHNFGDFILGRTSLNFNDEETLRLFQGGIDYYNVPTPADPEYNNPPAFPLRPGTDRARGVYFPNMSHRLLPGPIRGGIDYYKWGEFPSGAHEVSFPRVRAARAQQRAFYDFSYDTGTFVTRRQYFRPGGIYTLVLANEDRASKRFALMSIEEDPSISFRDDAAYVRFINTIERTGNAAADAQTDAVDVYVRKTNNEDLQRYAGRGLRFVPGDEETLAVAGLKRFATAEHVPFAEMDFASFYARQDTAYITRRETPAYIFLVYPAGQSARTGADPLQSYTQVFSNARQLDPALAENIIAPLARGGAAYYPTIVTVFVGADKLYYNLEQEGTRSRYLITNP